MTPSASIFVRTDGMPIPSNFVPIKGRTFLGLTSVARKWPFMATVLLVGCLQPPHHHPLPEPANIAASYDKTWAAVIDLFAAGSIPIRTMEKASGLIVAELLTVDHETSQRFADCGSTGLGAVPATRATYNVRVTGDSTASLVRVTAVFAWQSGECTSLGVFEQEMQDAIRVRATRP